MPQVVKKHRHCHVSYIQLCLRQRVPYDTVMAKRSYHDPGSLEAYLWKVIEERGVSMTALAKAAGLSKQSLHNYLNGTRPTLESCRKLAFYLNEPWTKIISMAYRDIDNARLESLIEMYLALPDNLRHTAEDILQVLARQADRDQEGRP
jgi:transcriptional regulator with XRE-family HTH domain